MNENGLSARRRGRRWPALLIAAATLCFGAATASADTDYTWSGAGTSPAWSTGADWTGDLPPSGSVGSLTFPQLTGDGCTAPSPADACYFSNNESSDISADGLVIDDNEPYEIGDNPISLGAGGVSASPDAAANGGSVALLSLPLTLTAPQTWTIDGGSYGDGLAVEGVSGDEPLTVDFQRNGGLELFTAETGPLTLSGDGSVVLADPQGQEDPADATAGELDTNGEPTTLQDGASLDAPYAHAESGPLAVSDGTVLVGEGLAPDGTLNVGGSLALSGEATLGFAIDQPGTAASSDYSQLTATGDVDLDGATLELEQGADENGLCDDLNPGDVDTLITTQGQISGEFAGVANGSTVTITNQCDTSTQTATATIDYTASSVTATILAAGNAGDVPQTAAAPTISGTPTVGDTLTVSAGTWSDDPTFGYQWFACTSPSLCSPISGATAASYLIPADEVGDTLAVLVTGSNALGSSTALSASTAAVGAAPASPPSTGPANLSAPVLTGTPAVGDVLSTSAGTWSGNPTGYAYDWLRCPVSGTDCTPISGATASTYTVTSADLGDRIESAVSARTADAHSQFVDSAPTATVTVDPAELVAPALGSGPPVVGRALAAASARFSGGSPITETYAWERCPGRTASRCTPIPGATLPSYVPTNADAGDGLRIVVVAHDAAGTAYAVSAITPAVIGAAQLRPGLRALVAAAGAASIPALLAHRGARIDYRALLGGHLTVSWTARVDHRRVLVAAASVRISGAGAHPVQVSLTTDGRRLLGRAPHELIAVTVAFTPSKAATFRRTGSARLTR